MKMKTHFSSKAVSCLLARLLNVSKVESQRSGLRPDTWILENLIR
jgi:hypothetical protein